MENLNHFIEYAPILIVILLFLWQNNLFVKPEQLERKHKEIIEEFDKKLKEMKEDFVQISAYKEFQNRVYFELTEVKDGINELKEYLIRGKI